MEDFFEIHQTFRGVEVLRFYVRTDFEWAVSLGIGFHIVNTRAIYKEMPEDFINEMMGNLQNHNEQSNHQQRQAVQKAIC